MSDVTKIRAGDYITLAPVCALADFSAADGIHVSAPSGNSFYISPNDIESYTRTFKVGDCVRSKVDHEVYMITALDADGFAICRNSDGKHSLEKVRSLYVGPVK